MNGGGKIKVLSIDGGGIRGIIPARILEQFENQMGRPLCQVFDLIAGTSTGGIIALGVGTPANDGRPYRPAELLQLYVENGPKIFAKKFWTPVRKWLSPKYSPKGLEHTLEAYFRGTELNTAAVPLLIASYDLQSQSPFFFKSHKIARNSAYNWRLSDVARATSAAPTFFPPLHLSRNGEDYALVDGGIFVNNPAMACYAEARMLYPNARDFVIVSVGTGDRNDRITYRQARKWGLLGWAKQIAPVMMDSVSEAVDYELEWIVGTGVTSKHYRLQPKLPEGTNEMDDASAENMSALRRLAESYLRENSNLISEICGELQAGRGSDVSGIGLTARG